MGTVALYSSEPTGVWCRSSYMHLHAQLASRVRPTQLVQEAMVQLGSCSLRHSRSAHLLIPASNPTCSE